MEPHINSEEYYIYTSEGEHLINNEENITDYLNNFLPIINGDSVIKYKMDDLGFNLNNNLTLPDFSVDNYETLTYMLFSASNFTRMEKYKQLENVHSWEQVILVYKPLNIDSITLQKHPLVCQQIIDSISFYKQILDKLINCYLDEEESINLLKWNEAINKNKSFLYWKINTIGKQIKIHSISKELTEQLTKIVKERSYDTNREFLDNLPIPKNVLNNLIRNIRKKLGYIEKN